MDTQKLAADLLRQTERSLRDFMQEALAAGDYQSLARIAGWADRLSVMPYVDVALEQSEGETASTGAIGRYEASSVGGASGTEPPVAGNDVDAAGGRPRRRDLKKMYPKFVAEGDYLIKIGWSKGKGDEYEQRAPRQVADAFVTKVLDLPGPRFTMEEVLPMTNGTGSEIPPYQVYLVLRWLRAERLVQKHGRNGYSLAEELAGAGDPLGLVRESWEKLPARP